MRGILAGLMADPCRSIAAMFDWRSLWRAWRLYCARGFSGFKSELASDTATTHSQTVSVAATPSNDPERKNTKKTILVIDYSIPRFDRDAGSRSSYQYLRLFVEMGLRVLFLPNDQIIRQPYADIMRQLGIEILAGKGIRCHGWKKWLRTNAETLDFVFLHRPNIARHYLEYAKEFTSARIFYCGHDLRFWRDARRYAIEGDRFYREESRYWEKIETELCKKADVTYFFSDAEAAEIIKRSPSVQARTIPLFLEDGDIEPKGLPFEARADLLFVGNFAHSPNIDAVQWFVREVLPKVRKSLPEIRLVIMGANPPEAISSLACGHILVTGTVSEQHLHEHYQRARVVVVPLRYGAGVKGKVIEAMRYGVPTVTTKVGAEGIPQDALTVADTAEQFAFAVSELYCHADLWEAAHVKSADLIQRYFSRDVAIEILKKDFQIS